MLSLGCGGWCCKIFLFICSGAIMSVGVLLTASSGMTLGGTPADPYEDLDPAKKAQMIESQCKLTDNFSSAMSPTEFAIVGIVVGVLMLLIGVGGGIGTFCNNNCMLNIQSTSLFILFVLKILFVCLIYFGASKPLGEIANIKVKMITKILNGHDTQEKLAALRKELHQDYTEKAVDKLFGKIDSAEGRKDLRLNSCCQMRSMHSYGLDKTETYYKKILKKDVNTEEFLKDKAICCGFGDGATEVKQSTKCDYTSSNGTEITDANMCTALDNKDWNPLFKDNVRKCNADDVKRYSPSGQQITTLIIAFIVSGVVELIAGIANCCFMHCVSSAKEERLNEKPPSAPKTNNAPVSQNPQSASQPAA